MDRNKLIEKLKKLAEERTDQELDHIFADNLLLEYINDEEITNLFDSIEKRYA